MRSGLIRLCICVTIFVVSSCKEDVEPPLDCSGLKLDLAGKSDASSCTVLDGQITVIATGGVEPYVYTMNGISNTTGLFAGLRGGEYTIKVTDAENKCNAELIAEIGTEGSTFTATASGEASTTCAPNSNGFLTINVSDGVPPYEFKLGNGPFVPENIFTELSAGQYVVEAKDAQDCIIVINAKVPGMRYATIKSIIDLNCAISGCHNGDNGANRNWTLFENVKENATNIRARTSNRTMPPAGNLSQEQIDLIACWVGEGANN